MGTQAGGQWVDLEYAVELLDTTMEAVRKRAKRGTLLSPTGEDGRLYVRVDGRVDGWADGWVDGEAHLVERIASEIDHLREQEPLDRPVHQLVHQPTMNNGE